MVEAMLLRPAGKDYLWGGNRLKTKYGKSIAMSPLAETWECSTQEDGLSMVVSGTYQGMTLAQVLKQNPEFLGEKAKPGAGLPILMKLIDAKQDLSLQVHPDDTYAAAHEDQRGKTEMWYVLEAVEGAVMVCGFAHKMTPAKLKQAVQTGNLTKHMHVVPVHKGDVFFIPPGTIHAIGAGTIIAEIQENSNVSYRIYDYNRLDKDGRPRPLHFEKAVQVLNMTPTKDVLQKPRKISYYPGCAREVLCRCQYFETERIQVSVHCGFSVTQQSFQVLLCTNGKGTLTVGTNPIGLPFRKGDCIFLPANLGRCHIRGRAELLKVRC